MTYKKKFKKKTFKKKELKKEFKRKHVYSKEGNTRYKKKVELLEMKNVISEIKISEWNGSKLDTSKKKR